MIKQVKTYYVIGLFLCSLSLGQDNVDVVTKVATAAANWLKLETGTRAIGMSGAYTAAGNDVSGIPYNPASMSFIKGQEGFLSTTQYVAGISYNVLGYATNMSGVDYAGIHLFFLDSGSMDVTNEFWNLKNSAGKRVAPGLYIYLVETDNGISKTGKFAIIR